MSPADVFTAGQTRCALGHDGELPSGVALIDRDGSKRVARADEIKAKWPHHNADLVRWRAEDGLEVEGILYSRTDRSPRTASPLIVVLQGGPRALATPTRLPNDIYTTEQWLEQGARVIFPNYRVSTG